MAARCAPVFSGQVQALRDLAVRPALGQQGEDVVLPLRQVVLARRPFDAWSLPDASCSSNRFWITRGDRTFRSRTGRR